MNKITKEETDLLIHKQVTARGYEFADSAEVISVASYDDFDPEFWVNVEETPDSNPHMKARSQTLKFKKSDLIFETA